MWRHTMDRQDKMQLENYFILMQEARLTKSRQGSDEELEKMQMEAEFLSTSWAKFTFDGSAVLPEIALGQQEKQEGSTISYPYCSAHPIELN